MRNDEINNKEAWLGKLKEKMNDYSEPTPANGWDQLEKELNSPKVIPMFPKKRAWAFAAAAAIIAALCTIGLFYINSPQVEELRQAAVEVIEQNPDALLPIAQLEEPMKIAQAESFSRESNTNATEKSNHRSSQISQTNQSTADVYNQQEVEEISANKEFANELNVATQQEPSTNNDKEVEQNQENQNAKRVPLSKPSSKDKLHIPLESSSRNSKSNWSIGAGVSNAGNFANNNELNFNGNVSRIDLSNSEDELMVIPEDFTVVFSDGIPYMLSANEIIEAKHHQPIAVGLSFRYPLKHGLSIETGINFTLLSSSITKASNPNLSLSQKLYYLGIPLKINWSFFEKKYVTLYATAGGQIEKSVYGKLGNEKINEKPLQFSVMGGVGAQFNITNHFGIYIEPGVAYFFKNNSDILTIRKDSPFNFNMQAGIRYTY